MKLLQKSCSGVTKIVMIIIKKKTKSQALKLNDHRLDHTSVWQSANVTINSPQNVIQTNCSSTNTATSTVRINMKNIRSKYPRLRKNTNTTNKDIFRVFSALIDILLEQKIVIT